MLPDDVANGSDEGASEVAGAGLEADDTGTTLPRTGAANPLLLLVLGLTLVFTGAALAYDWRRLRPDGSHSADR
ncbi:MAG: LPXTG cell wall anchor domain-containing protein [Acidimicrobiales bacterium]|nr:LPXTG cell wall anchor domain-containing protein [Acidimicrobiales bacterium]